ncbi:MAG: tripartite tricarboxylate transporter substrate binding protein [Burkholderiaceae bacterium]|nr:tripartite tricarboxylate transporter substrate binding protein [Burkholderiaceae bacterium]
MDRRQLIKATLGGAGLAAAHASWAQSGYPNRPLRLIIPFAPGGSTDVLGRKTALRLGQYLGQPIVVDNKAGAAGVLGCVEGARAAPDGYTLVMGTTGTHAINPSSMAKPAYDAVRDFAPVTMLGTQPMSIAVNPKIPVNTLAELIALIRSQPGKFSYGSAGNGGIAHLSFELFKTLVGGLDAPHIPYKGGAPALQDVVAGHVPILADTFSSTLPQHKLKTLRVIAMTGERRSRLAPDIPAGTETVPGLVTSTCGLLLAPARTPRAIIETLHQAVAKLVRDPAFMAELDALNIEASTDASPEYAASFISSEIAKWAPVVKATGTTM